MDGFWAVDVETANPNLSSICQIGLVRFEGGTVVHRHAHLVNPMTRFDHWNVAVHGIRSQDVEGAPTFDVLFPEIARTLANAIVVHHTAFDRVAVCRAATKHDLPAITCRWLDSACVARRAWERFAQTGYGLANVAREIGITFEHHNAAEDAEAAGKVMLAAMAATGLTIADWLTHIRQPLRPSGECAIARAGNPEGPLYGETIVFTGALIIPRREAAELAATAGCVVEESVNARTTLLVVGDQDINRLAGHKTSGKHRKAEDLISRGQPIRILGESDFSIMVA